MPSTPLTFCSMGSATSRVTVAAVAPGVAGGDDNGRRRDVGILRYRQPRQCD